MVYQKKIYFRCHVQFGIDQRFIYLQGGRMTHSLDHVMRPRIAMPGTTLYFIHPLLNSSSISRECLSTRSGYHSLFALSCDIFLFLFLSLLLLFSYFFSYHFLSFFLLFSLTLPPWSTVSPSLHQSSHTLYLLAVVQSHLVPHRKFPGQFLYFFLTFSFFYFSKIFVS